MATSMRAVLSVPMSKRDHVQGPETAPVTLVEYGDFECPYCAAAHVIIKEVEELVGDKLRFVFRHFPLTQIHPHAESAAEASEASAAQGQFWEMHDLLYENQPRLDRPHLMMCTQKSWVWIAKSSREKWIKESIVSGYEETF